MKKLHDLRTLLSDGAILSSMDCMRTKGGSAGKRRNRPSNDEAASQDLAGIDIELIVTETTP